MRCCMGLENVESDVARLFTTLILTCQLYDVMSHMFPAEHHFPILSKV